MPYKIKQPRTSSIPSDEFQAIYSMVPRLTVELVIRTDMGILLTRRSIPPQVGKWHLPGGTVFFGESLPDAVRAVAKDELGVDVEVGKLLGYVEYPKQHAEGYNGWPVGIAFEVTLKDSEVSGGRQGEEVAFFAELPQEIIEEQKAFLDSLTV